MRTACARVTRVTATESHSSVNSAKSCSWHTRPKESREARTAATPPADGARGRGGGTPAGTGPRWASKTRGCPLRAARVWVFGSLAFRHTSHTVLSQAQYFTKHTAALWDSTSALSLNHPRSVLGRRPPGKGLGHHGRARPAAFSGARPLLPLTCGSLTVTFSQHGAVTAPPRRHGSHTLLKPGPERS